MEQSRVPQVLTAVGAAVVAALLVLAYMLGSVGEPSAKAATPSAGTPAPNVVTVGGTGKAAGKPDTMVTTVSVTAKDANPAAALDSANKTMTAVQHVLTSHGVAAKDLKTTGLSVNPNYVYANGTQTLDGYVANEDLQVTLRDLATAGATVTAVTAAGGDQVRVGGITLDLEADSALVTDARTAAFGDAKAKAQQYAALAGRSLGNVVSLIEQVDQPQEPQMYAAGAAAASPAAVPIAAGSQNVSVNVTVVWSLN
jgi:uncharacterized protein YggE